MHPPALGSKGMREAHTTNDDQQNREHEKKEKNRKNANSFCNFFSSAAHKETRRQQLQFSNSDKWKNEWEHFIFWSP